MDYRPSNRQVLGSIARKYGVALSDDDYRLSLAYRRQGEYLARVLKARGSNDLETLSKREWNELDQILLHTVGVESHDALHDIMRIFEERMFKFQVPCDTIDTLHWLKDRGFLLGIISNLQNPKRITERYEELSNLDILHLFDVITFSGEVGLLKPDPAIFHHSVSQMPGVGEHESLHVGDSYFFDVEGARAAGMIPVLLDPNPSCALDCEVVSSLHAVVPFIERYNDRI